MMEIKIIKEESEGGTPASVTDINPFLTYKASKFPNLVAEVILISKLHSKYLSDLDNIVKQLFLVAM